MATGNIKVVVRVRPFNGRELDRKAKCVVQMKDEQTVLLPPPDAEERLRGGKGAKGADGQKVFAFDKSYWSFNRTDPHFAGQDNLFDDLGSPLLDNAFKGYNNCIFAYGQTGSGKSYSMMGYGEESGVIPRICENLFERITELQKDKNLTYTVEVSYLEIYNERVRDLLNPSTKGNLKVREHPATGPYVEDLAKLVVRSFQEIQQLMDEGNKARTVAATNMNETSSRSHAVFTLTVTQKRHDVETSMDTEKVAKISLVDLAGSERATSSGATGARLKEGAEINRSLSTLGRVIAALADLATGKKRNTSMVPYRDSVLTWLLKDSLGGNSMTAMIAAISPADINFEETLSTLRYADSAKRIKNHAVINEDPNARMIRELKEELAQLRSKLGGHSTSGGAPEEQYAPDTPLDKQFVSITQLDGTVKKVSKADIAEQLNQSEKLYEDLNQTWEEKLQKTEQIHKEREAALEELGISIEKGFIGLSTPKKMPHLVNLSDDPLLAECLVYNIKPGTTTVGNMDNASTTSEIRLNGSKILKEHCAFENADGQVTIVPSEGAAIMVNGLRVDKPTRLRSGNRVILGDFHIFRFNHPQEARAERKEHSLLKHSVTNSQFGSPLARPAHSRTMSRADSDIDGDSSRPDSPQPPKVSRDSDWSNARREAAGAILGVDQRISNLTDDELDSLFDDVQRARAVRKGRPESRLFGPEDEDIDSISSFAVRDKYMSNGSDIFSLDTATTVPSSPPQDDLEGIEGEHERIQTEQKDTDSQMERQKNDMGEEPKATESSTHNPEDTKLENAHMEEALKAARQEFESQLEQQRQNFHKQLHEASKAPSPRVTQDGFTELQEQEKVIARSFISRWKRIRHVRLAEIILQNGSMLKEAQIMSQELDKNVVFQFTIVGEGQAICSSYDLVLAGIPGDEDPALENATRPCVAIRVVDYQHGIVHLWSLSKLEHRLRMMRQMHQYLHRPGYSEHFRLDDPFIDPCLPQYSLVGDVSIPLTAVFEARVQDYAVEVFSTYTYEAIGMIRVSLEPSSAQAPSMIKFNVVVHDMIGFAEREGTEVHAQMSIPGVYEEGGVSTTQMIKDFDENPVRLGSVHSMSLPLRSSRSASLLISIYAKITTMHLDKLLSWDQIREPNDAGLKKRDIEHSNGRVSESQYFTQEQHDVFAKVKILEMSETGEYVTVEVEQHSNTDPGTYQLRQGLQRKVVVNLAYSSVESLQWKEVRNMRVSNLRLFDTKAAIPYASNPSAEVILKISKAPKIIENGNGTKELTVTGQWDSSLHGSSLLDRPTAETFFVQMTLSIDVVSHRLDDPMTFSLDQNLQIRPRSWLRPQSLFKQLWKTTRIVHTTSGIFSVRIKPSSTKRATDIWRMNSQLAYINGEEVLINWKPRGVGLVRDFSESQRRRQHLRDVEAAKVFLDQRSPSQLSENDDQPTPLLPNQGSVLAKCVHLWTRKALPSHIRDSRLSPSDYQDGSSVVPSPLVPRLFATIHHVAKNPSVLKSSYILAPTVSSVQPLRWQRHFAELRPPYLHVYAVPSGDETSVINLRNARIDTNPPVQKLLQSDRVGGNCWAVYGAMNTWLFAARSEIQKAEWVLAIDGCFAGGNGIGN